MLPGVSTSSLVYTNANTDSDANTNANTDADADANAEPLLRPMRWRPRLPDVLQ